MFKLQKALKAILLLLKNPWLLNNVLNAEEVQRNNYFAKHGNYKGLPTIDLGAITNDTEDTVFPFTF
jgi:hypothetical protein